MMAMWDIENYIIINCLLYKLYFNQSNNEPFSQWYMLSLSRCIALKTAIHFPPLVLVCKDFHSYIIYKKFSKLSETCNSSMEFTNYINALLLICYEIYSNNTRTERCLFNIYSKKHDCQCFVTVSFLPQEKAGLCNYR